MYIHNSGISTSSHQHQSLMESIRPVAQARDWSTGILGCVYVYIYMSRPHVQGLFYYFAIIT